MVSDEVSTDFIPDDAKVHDAVFEGDMDEGVVGIEGEAEPSALERICAEYIENKKRPKAFIDRFARVMNADERVRKICRVRTLKIGADLKDVEEVLQRVMIVFFTSQISKMREANAIYAVIYSIAANVSREVFRDGLVLTHNHDSIEDMRERGIELEQVGLADSQEKDRDHQIDTQIAAAKMARAFQMHQNGEIQLNTNHGVFSVDFDPLIQPVAPSGDAATVEVDEPETRVARPRKTSAGAADKLSRDQRELVSIIEATGMRNQDFAAALCIGLPRLSSYIYGRTASVPEDIMERARELLSGDPEVVAQRERFKRPMSEILDEWAAELGATSDVELGNMLGVTKMTIYRWRQNETKPDQTSLVRYESQIQMHKRRAAEIEKKLRERSAKPSKRA
ncbi:hypothetical protein A9R05_41585 (plasmid) [Burkholderia sp. KK1]|nr:MULTISPECIES: hypothetical protein [Burkholderia]AQH05523.1 hypothetical protein A9R05_41585 [Burkholderia sp. KK1]